MASLEMNPTQASCILEFMDESEGELNFLTKLYSAPEQHLNLVSKNNQNECISTDCSSSGSEEDNDDDEDSFLCSPVKAIQRSYPDSSQPKKVVQFPHQTICPSLFNPRRQALEKSPLSSCLSTKFKNYTPQPLLVQPQQQEQPLLKVVLLKCAFIYKVPEQLSYVYPSVQNEDKHQKEPTYSGFSKEDSNLTEEDWLLKQLYDAPELL